MQEPRPAIEGEERAQPLSLEDQIAFLKSVADYGRNQAPVTGIHMIIWGTVMPIAFLAHYYIEAIIGIGNSVSGAAIGYAYLGSVLVGWIGSAITGYRTRPNTVQTSNASFVYGSMFQTAGISLTVLAVGIMVTQTLPPVSLILWASLLMGLCFSVTGHLTRWPWLTYTGYCWFGAAVIFLWLLQRTEILLVAAFFWALLSIGPGIAFLLLSRPKHQAKANGTL